MNVTKKGVNLYALTPSFSFIGIALLNLMTLKSSWSFLYFMVKLLYFIKLRE